MAASRNSKRESKHNQRELIDAIKQKTKDVIQNRKHINLLIDIQSSLENEEGSVVQASIKGLEKVFSHLIQKGYLSERGLTHETPAEKQVREWSSERYLEFQDFLLAQISSSEQSNLQEQSLVTLLHLLQVEGQCAINQAVEGKKNYFPLDFLEKITAHLLDADRESSSALTRFQEFLEYDDVLFHLLRVLSKICRSRTETNDKNLANLLQLLEHITLPKETLDGENRKLFCYDKEHFKWNYNQAKKFFSTIWQSFLKYPLTPSLYKNVLVLLPDKVMPHLEKPLLLTDFLMESYSIGGSVSILALHGVFLLMQNHNLEYPEFYTKLYALLEPSVLFVKYRARFFYLLDLFLTSTHVPEYIAAAFAKRLSRLALIAPTNVIILLLHFVGNIILRHRGLLRLMHNPADQVDLDSDPYLMDEANLNSCNAVDSSLWEIKTLQCHALPEIAYAAKFIDRELPKTEWDISQDLELTTEDLMEKELKRKYSDDDVPLNFEKPAKFACVKYEKFEQCFELPRV